MAQTTAARRVAPVVAGRSRLLWRGELITMVLATWFMIGAFLDAWAHTNLAVLETFFTPWHGVLYSGFAATAAWIAWQAVRAQQAGHRGWDAVPLGYGWGVIGVAVFAAGAIGGMLWHTIFGIEQDVEAAVSPTHQILLVGTLLVLSNPFRAAWTSDPLDHSPRYRAFLPALLSLTYVSTFVALIVVFLTTFFTAAPAGDFSDGIGSILVTTVLLVAPVLLMARRWRLPLGAVTTSYTVMATLLGAVDGWSRQWLPVAVAAAGLATDLLLRRLAPSVQRPAVFWAAGFVAPLLLWAPWFIATALTEGITWSVDLWSGTLAWTALLGLALSLLMIPPRPAER